MPLEILHKTKQVKVGTAGQDVLREMTHLHDLEFVTSRAHKVASPKRARILRDLAGWKCVYGPPSLLSSGRSQDFCSNRMIPGSERWVESLWRRDGRQRLDSGGLFSARKVSLHLFLLDISIPLVG